MKGLNDIFQNTVCPFRTNHFDFFNILKMKTANYNNNNIKIHTQLNPLNVDPMNLAFKGLNTNKNYGRFCNSFQANALFLYSRSTLTPTPKPPAL